MRLADHVAAVAVFAVVLLGSGAAFAGDRVPGSGDSSDKPAVYRLEEIVVSATRSPVDVRNVAADITVIRKEEMANMPVSTVAEVLRYVPGVYVEFAGGVGAQAAARIQGAEVRHTAVYLDGIPLNILDNPFTDLSTLPVSSIERIEIYKGAASSAWGSALGGVINIITRDPETDRRFSGDVRVSAGESNTWKTGGAAGGTVEQFGYFLSANQDRSDGFYEHSGYRRTTAHAKIAYAPAPAARISLTAGAGDGKQHDPIIGYPEFWDDMRQERDYQRLLLEIAPSDALEIALEGRRHRFDALIEDVYPDRREVFNDYTDETWGGGARLRYGMGKDGALTLGVDGDWGQYDWHGYDRTYYTGNWALYANQTLIAGPVSVNAGARYDRNRDFGSEISPSAGAVWHLMEGRALVRAQVARGFSAPPPSWVNDPVAGNPDLDAETAVNYQAGGRIRVLSFVSVETNLFYADVDSLIRYDDDARRFVNIDRAVRKGVEGVLTAAFDMGLQASFAAVCIDVRDKESDRRIKDIPAVQYHVSTAYTYKWMTHTLLGTWTDHNSSFPETRDQRFVWDYRFRAVLPEWAGYGKPAVFVNIYNIFNTNYLYREVWPQPGRWAEAGVSLSF